MNVGRFQGIARRACLMAGAAAVLALGACSSGSSDAAKSAPTTDATTTTVAPPGAQRPEGPWTLVSWITKRSDIDAPPKQAVVVQTKVKPGCATGPCDLTVEPDGIDGSFRPAGYAALSAKDDTKDPYTLTWDAKSKSYTYTSEPSVSSCTVAGGKVIPDGYEVSKTLTLTFVPPASGSGPALSGTKVVTARGVGPGIAAGCTDLVQTETVAGAPTPASSASDDTDLTGAYTVTEIIESAEPATDPPGSSVLISKSATVARQGKGYTITGTDKPATLDKTRSGWAGSTPSMLSDCKFSDHVVANGYASTATWSDLHRVAIDHTGAPVLVGRWLWRATPSAEAAAEKCASGQDQGFVILVPND